MMHRHQEAPDTRLERYLTIALWIAILLAGDQLVLRILSDEEGPHTGEFIGLALLVGLALYLGLLFLHLVTVRYTVADGQLIFRQGWRQVVIDLDREISLHRWRSRWAWSGGASRDLPVEEIDLFPPLGTFRQGAVWVVVGDTPSGDRQAVALRPSPRLLALLKERVAVQRGAGD